MLFFRKKHGFKVFRRLYSRYSGYLPLIVAFSAGMFGTSVYYKNKSINVTNNQGSQGIELEAATNQLNNERDITESLSRKNIELKKKLKETVANINDKDASLKINNLNAELSKEKQINKKLTDESSRLKLRINNILAKVEASKNDNARTTQWNRNSTQSTEEAAKDKNYNKVKIELTEENQPESELEPKANRNRAKKPVEVAGNDKPKEVVKTITGKEKRTMKLKKGESLWNLSKRAYGKGIYYKRIIKANPSITEKSFKKLRPGTRVNVPL